MKNKCSTFLVITMIGIILGTSNASAGETNAGHGAKVGAITGGIAFGLIGGLAAGSLQGLCGMSDEPGACDSPTQTEAALIGLGIGATAGALAGAGIGALIGLAIPKHKNISIAPTFDPTPGAVGGGVNLSLNF